MMVVRSRERHMLAITPSKTTFYPTDVPYLGLEFQSYGKKDGIRYFTVLSRRHPSGVRLTVERHHRLG